MTPTLNPPNFYVRNLHLLDPNDERYGSKNRHLTPYYQRENITITPLIFRVTRTVKTYHRPSYVHEFFTVKKGKREIIVIIMNISHHFTILFSIDQLYVLFICSIEGNLY